MRKLLYILLLFGSLVQAQFTPLVGIVASSGGGTALDYSIENITDDGVSFLISGQVTFGYGIETKPDGTRFYVQDATAVSEYTMTAGDVTSAAYQTPDKTIAAGGGTSRGFTLADNGTKAYSSNTVERQDRYSLSTAYDLSTMSATNQNHVMTDEVANIDDIAISPDGTKYWLLAEEHIWQYTLSTAWDLTSETYDGVNIDFTAFLGGGQGTDIEFSPDGKKLLVLKVVGQVYQYSLPTAWDITGATKDTFEYDWRGTDVFCWGLKYTNNGTQLLIQGYDTDRVYQFSLNN